MLLPPIKERIQKGIELLNRIRPNWYNEIDLDIISMNRPCDCILGQLYNNYYDAEIDLHIDGIEYGFDIDMQDICSYNYKTGMLTDLWIEEINKLRSINNV